MNIGKAYYHLYQFTLKLCSFSIYLLIEYEFQSEGCFTSSKHIFLKFAIFLIFQWLFPFPFSLGKCSLWKKLYFVHHVLFTFTQQQKYTYAFLLSFVTSTFVLPYGDDDEI